MRIRTIKPEFYQSEELGEVSREVRHLAAALITWADDEGYFRTHPALIAGALFPFDPDGREFVAHGLAELERVEFVELFEGGVGFLPGFSRHQVINRVTPSRLKDKASKRLNSVSTHGGLTEDSLSTHGVLTAGREGNGREVEGKGTSSGADVSVDDTPHPLAEVWNAHKAPKMPTWTTTGRLRRKHADARLADRDLDAWAEVVKRIAASDFASGRTGQWCATPDWLVKSPENATKVLEGNYDNRTGPPGRSNGAPVAAESFDWTQQTPGEVAL